MARSAKLGEGLPPTNNKHPDTYLLTPPQRPSPPEGGEGRLARSAKLGEGLPPTNNKTSRHIPLDTPATLCNNDIATLFCRLHPGMHGRRRPGGAAPQQYPGGIWTRKDSEPPPPSPPPDWQSGGQPSRAMGVARNGRRGGGAFTFPAREPPQERAASALSSRTPTAATRPSLGFRTPTAATRPSPGFRTPTAATRPSLGFRPPAAATRPFLCRGVPCGRPSPHAPMTLNDPK